ncbi:hypothetical protein D3C86_1703220 [compost metagenome]
MSLVLRSRTLVLVPRIKLVLGPGVTATGAGRARGVGHSSSIIPPSSWAMGPRSLTIRSWFMTAMSKRFMLPTKALSRSSTSSLLWSIKKRLASQPGLRGSHSMG